MVKYDTLSDEQLIDNLRGGDLSVTDYIMEKYKFLVKKKAKDMYLLGGDNDDLIQEGMIGLFKAVRDYKEEQGASFYSFADLCISRQMYTAIEASQRQKHIPLNSYVSLYGGEETEDDIPLIDVLQQKNESDPEEIFLNKEHLKRLEEELLSQLSTLERDVLLLYIAENDYCQIAGIMGKSKKTIDNALQRIKAKAEKIILEMKTEK